MPIRFDDVIAGHDAAVAPPPAAELETDRIADILFTTGTTGKSKGVMLSHGAIATACAHINAFIGTGNQDIEVLPLPLSHSFGLGRLRCVLSAGATLILAAGFINAAGIVRTLRDYHATGIASVPAGLAILLSDERFALQRFSEQLKYMEIGSAPMPISHKRELMRQLPKTRICMHYGLTEASRSAFLSFHDDADHLDSIGQPSAGVAMRIVDDHGVEAEPGTEGHLQVRGGHLMTGYWNDPELTSKTLKDGWLATGDLGRMEDDGYFYIGARTSDIINVGGRKVSPQEIEELLTGHPDVAECACVGVPDPQGLSGEIVVAFLVARSGLDKAPKFSELAKLIRKNLESYKVPRKFIWTEKIPKSGSGKVLRRRLKEMI
jgi:long-chain acyl-CoA synthetase